MESEHKPIERPHQTSPSADGLVARLAVAEQRIFDGAARDAAADGRDLVASARDRVAAMRDRELATQDAAVAGDTAGKARRAAASRAAAAEHRSRAAADRAHAARDRQQAACERLEARAELEALLGHLSGIDAGADADLPALGHRAPTSETAGLLVSLVDLVGPECGSGHVHDEGDAELVPVASGRDAPAAGATASPSLPALAASTAPAAISAASTTLSGAQERRRLAGDIHDLVMQDLAIVLAQARMLERHEAGARVVVEASERALAAARALVHDLVRVNEPPLEDALKAAIGPALQRLAVDVRLHVPDGAHPDRATRDALVGIAREAVTNAVKHAEPQTIEILVGSLAGWRLIVRDDGRGFDPTTPSRGFGATAMRNRASAAGGTVRVHSEPGRGTVVEAVLP